MEKKKDEGDPASLPSVREFQIRLAIGGILSIIIATIVVGVGLHFQSQRLQVDANIRDLSRENDTILPSLREAILLGHESMKAYQLDYIRRNADVETAMLHSEESGKCPLWEYTLSGFQVCWRGLRTVELDYDLELSQNPSHLRITLKDLGIDTAVIEPLAVIFSILLLITSGTFVVFYLMVKKNITEPVRVLHRMFSEEEVSQDASTNLFILKEFAALRAALERYRESKNYEAIKNTVEMMSHDVGKPFEVAKLAFSQFKEAGSIDEIREIIPECEHTIENAHRAVNSIFSDILEYGKPITPKYEAIPLWELIALALKEVSLLYSGTKIGMNYKWNHKHLITCDLQRARIALANIFGNAVQAMKGRGTIWIETSEETEGKNQHHFVKIEIRNSGSSIQRSDLNRVFEAFYTRGKRKGTGLGLAIAKRNIEVHGGRISADCDERNSTVSFSIYLPAYKLTDSSKPIDPPTTLQGFGFKKDGEDSSLNQSPEYQNELIARLVKFSDSKGRRIRVGVLDDNILEREALSRIINKTKLKDVVEIKEFSSSDDLFKFDLSKLDFLFSDWDLGEAIDGFDVVRELRVRAKGLPVCIHSNKATSREDNEKALAAGASGFFPKPMTLDHFLRYLTNELPISGPGE